MADLLERVLEAHGGLDAWRAASGLELRYRAGGLAFASKGRGLRLHDWHARVDLSRPRTEFVAFPRAGQTGVLDGESVRIESGAGKPAEAREDPRRTIRRPRHMMRWDDLNLLYFGGYAIWGYATFPFHMTLPGVEVEETSDDRLLVRYPEGWPVHSREQEFQFDADGLLVRNDYTAEVFGRWARSKHLCENHRTFDGLVLPTRRHVHPRAAGWITLVRIEIDEVSAL